MNVWSPGKDGFISFLYKKYGAIYCDPLKSKSKWKRFRYFCCLCLCLQQHLWPVLGNTLLMLTRHSPAPIRKWGLCGLRKHVGALGSWIWIHLWNVKWREELNFNLESVDKKYLVYSSCPVSPNSYPQGLCSPGLMGGSAWLSCLVLWLLQDCMWFRTMAGSGHLNFRCPQDKDFNKDNNVSLFLKPII